MKNSPEKFPAQTTDNVVGRNGLHSRKLSVREAAQYLGLSKSLLDKKRLDGTGPTYLKLGRRVLYDIEDLETWVARSKRNHTSES